MSTQLSQLIFLCLIFHVKAQEEKSNSEQNFLHPLHPNLAVVIGVLSVTFSLLLLVLAYAKFCHTNPFNVINNTLHHQLIRSSSRFLGIDKTVIQSLPFFRFSSLKGSKEGLECAVCISRFEETEILRLLPKCRHAFHMTCIDEWLERHASCPLCRYRFDVKDLRSFSYSNSLRFSGNPANLTEDQNLEIFIEREQDHQSSSTNTETVRKEKNVNQESHDRKLLHKFRHKIIVSDVVIKHRWSDVNSSDFLFLNSEMLSFMSSNRFSRSSSTSGRFHNEFSVNDNMVKIKEDMERKRLYESKFSEIYSDSSCFRSTSCNEANSSSSSKGLLNATEKRSMSEVTSFARFREYSVRQKLKEAAMEKEERIRKVWLPIVRQTVQWFAGRERNFQELEQKRLDLNV